MKCHYITTFLGAISSKYARACGSISVRIGLAFAGLVFMVAPVAVKAEVNYQWTSNLAGTDRAQGVKSAQFGAAVNWTNGFVGFMSLTDVNFIDLKLSQYNAANQTSRVVIVVCTSLSGSYPAVCNGSTVIATSTAFSSADVLNNSIGDFYRIRFTEPWSASFTSGSHLYFVPYSLDYPETNISIQYIPGNPSTTTAHTAYFGTTGGEDYNTSLRIGYDTGVSATYADYSLVPSSEACTFSESFDVTASLEDSELYQGPWYVDQALTLLLDDGTHESFGLTTQIVGGVGTSVFDCSEYGEGGRITVSHTDLWAQVSTSSAPEKILAIGFPTNFVIGSTSLSVVDAPFTTHEQGFYEGSGTTSATYTWADCSIGVILFAPSACIQFLLVPNQTTIMNAIGYATSTLSSYAPLSWLIFAWDTFSTPIASYATGTLPNVIITVPSGLPGQGSSVNITPWPVMKTLWETTGQNQFYTATTSTFAEVLSPYINIITDVLFSAGLLGAAFAFVL